MTECRQPSTRRLTAVPRVYGSRQAAPKNGATQLLGRAARAPRPTSKVVLATATPAVVRYTTLMHPFPWLTVSQAADVLRRGGIVALPTETVYGLGADATQPNAVARVFAAKQRPTFDPLIVHLADVRWIDRAAAEWPPLAQQLAERFWPGPLTIVVPRQTCICDLVTSGLDTVAVRVPQHPMMQQVLRLADRPIAAPSANPFGRLSPTTAEHVVAQLGTVIDGVVDGGPCAVGIESTIVRPDGDQLTVLRLGGTTLEALREVVPQVVVMPEADRQTVVPGSLPQHYAPHTPLRLVDHLPNDWPYGGTGCLVLRRGSQAIPPSVAVEVLSERGDLVEAAANFFPALHRLDQRGLTEIIAVRLPEVGLGRALNDRLQRAAATHHSG
jgi:L-threonylcarbamoyladenylate synthase